MGKIIFILGGARSGKSTYAIELAKEKQKKVAFIATGLASDKEMKDRIKLHKKIRPSHWQTFEEPTELDILIKKICLKFNTIIIDCLTLFISNLLLQGLSESAVENKLTKVINTLRPIKCKSIFVSNEVGLGIVPKNRLARRFRDVVGKMNQLVSKEAHEVFFMLSGYPLKIK